MRSCAMRTAGRNAPAILKDVTLVAVTSVALEATVNALLASIRQAEFGAVLLLSDQEPPATDPAICWRQINRLSSRADYSRFMLRELAAHIDTDHALCIQWDGFVLDGKSWDPRFLDYDYIGAVWPHFSDGHNVGNGGFSLRSKRLLDACRRLPAFDDEAEDIIISRICRPRLEELGMRFAPEVVAQEFAYERMSPTGREFGFHGAFNLVRFLSANDASGLFRILEPTMLARNELREIFWWSLTHGRLGLATAMVRRLVSRRL